MYNKTINNHREVLRNKMDYELSAAMMEVLISYFFILMVSIQICCLGKLQGERAKHEEYKESQRYLHSQIEGTKSNLFALALACVPDKVLSYP